ncbi:type II toxin-antitoxin system death-on-curing family toxin [Oceanobacillus locisalsi]|uniref:Type II toxin-antitoxin system death-on-curing family toxin n=1 Tax=Oceanobacillus locisalsi TaxID=546107 RepID=A0ABW3NL31_9BACI
MRYVTVQEAEAINKYVIMKFSPKEQVGVKDYSLLESAVYRPQQSVLENEAYPLIEEKAAALLESLAQNHPFYNANKRTAFLAMMQFLSYNGYSFGMHSQKEQEDFIVDIVTHRLAFAETVHILKKNIRSL